MNKNVLIVSGVGLLAAGALWYFFVRKPKGDPDYDVTDGPTPADPNVPSGTPGYSSTWDKVSFPIRRGMAGYEVKVLQAYANEAKKTVLAAQNLIMKVDGYYGKNTQKALSAAHLGSRFDKMTYEKYYAYLKSKGKLPAT